MLLNLLGTNPLVFLAILIAIVLAISVHEFSHVLAAYVQGDETGKDLGRLSLNPLVHIDFVGLIAFLFVGFGWGKPAPYNPHNLRNPRLGSVLVGLAGPFSNLCFIIFAAILYRIAVPTLHLPSENMLVIFLQVVVQFNAALLLFNLLPIPPLDGSHVLLYFIPDSAYRLKMAIEQYGFFILLGFLAINYSLNGALLDWLGGVISGIMRIALG